MTGNRAGLVIALLATLSGVMGCDFTPIPIPEGPDSGGGGSHHMGPDASLATGSDIANGTIDAASGSDFILPAVDAPPEAFDGGVPTLIDGSVADLSSGADVSAGDASSDGGTDGSSDGAVDGARPDGGVPDAVPADRPPIDDVVPGDVVLPPG